MDKYAKYLKPIENQRNIKINDYNSRLCKNPEPFSDWKVYNPPPDVNKVEQKTFFNQVKSLDKRDKKEIKELNSMVNKLK